MTWNFCIGTATTEQTYYYCYLVVLAFFSTFFNSSIWIIIIVFDQDNHQLSNLLFVSNNRCPFNQVKEHMFGTPSITSNIWRVEMSFGFQHSSLIVKVAYYMTWSFYIGTTDTEKTRYYCNLFVLIFVLSILWCFIFSFSNYFVFFLAKIMDEHSDNATTR